MQLIGMVHLGPLPGSPRFGGNLDAVLEAARRDARTLAETGFDAVLVENFGDAPFEVEVQPITVSAMTRAVEAVRSAIDIPVGVNVLRNDAIAALSIAATTGATFIRVNVLSGVMFTDQGIVEGRAAHLARLRRLLGADVAVFADVHVKHAVPPSGYSLEAAARDLAERAGADALIASGAATGSAIDMAELRQVRQAVPDVPLYVGSGATTANVAALLTVADGVIVGTAVKRGGVTTAPVDPGRSAAFVEAAGS